MQQDQNPNWHKHLSTLCLHIVWPHIQPLGINPTQLMFDHKAPMPCDNWLGLTQYNNSESISKISWVQEQYELVQAANKWVLKSIWQSAQKGAQRQKSKSLDITEGNLVLLWDHPEWHNKIQHRYKETEFVMTCGPKCLWH